MPDKITDLKKNLNEVTQIMINNVDNILERGEKLDSLVEKSDNLTKEAKTFRDNSKSLRSKFCIKNLKFSLIIVAIVIVLVLIIIFSIYNKISHK
jgi:hypothetical protein